MSERHSDHKGRRRRDAKAAFREQGEQSRAAKRRKDDGPEVQVYITGSWISASGLLWDEPVAPIAPLPVRHTKEAVLAYRGWRLAWLDGEPLLQSITAGVTWDGPTLRSGAKPPERCRNYALGAIWFSASGGDAAPKQNDWGIFCYRAPNAALELGAIEILGEIALMGRVVAHTRGYRAEMATIRKLVVTPQAFAHGDPVEALARRYHCDVSTDFRTLLEASNGHR